MSSVLVRLPTGEIRRCGVHQHTTLANVLAELGHERHGLVKVERDTLGRVVGTTNVNPRDDALQHCHQPTEEEGEARNLDADLNLNSNPGLNEPDRMTREQYSAQFGECNLWVGGDRAHRVRIFFNPYTRMVLGLPHWTLDVYVDEDATAAHVEHLLRCALGMSPDDDRFALFGNYRSHVSVVGPTVPVLETTREEDPEGDKFWQWMMRPQCEAQHNLGIARQSALAISESGKLLGNRKYWFVLQGTTLYYFKSPRDRSWQRAIENVDACRCVYRGGNHQKTLYTFELVDPHGKAYRLASHSKKRVEKWIKSLRSCHRSLEINEPLTTAMVAKFRAPQPAPPLFDSAREQPRHQHHSAAGRAAHPHQDSLVDPKDQEPETVNAPGHSLAEVEKLLRRIELGANTLKTRQKLRRKEAFIWVEAIRAYMIAILRVDRPGYAYDVVPEIKSLVVEVKNFAAAADGRSEFVLTQDQNGDFIELIMDNVNCLFSLYRDAVTLGGGWDSQMGESVHQRENQMALVKLRRALKRPIMRVRVDGVPGVKPEDDGPQTETKGKAKWWARLTSKRKAAIPAEEAQDMSRQQADAQLETTQPDTPLETAAQSETPLATPAREKTSRWRLGWNRSLRGDASCTSGDATPRTPRVSRSVWRFLSALNPRGSADSARDHAGIECDDVEYDAEIEDGGLDRKPRREPRMIINETGAPVDGHEAGAAAPSTPLKSCHRAQDSLDHHRKRSSLRPVRPIHAGTVSPRTPKGGDDSRGLLKALMRTRMSDSESGGNSPVACHVCAGPIQHGEPVQRTPFAAYHMDCLRCDDCGQALTEETFKLEYGKLMCRSDCPGASSPRPRSVLKNAV